MRMRREEYPFVQVKQAAKNKVPDWVRDPSRAAKAPEVTIDES